MHFCLCRLTNHFFQIDEDAYQEDLGYSRGTIGKAGTGRIRLPQMDEKTKVSESIRTSLIFFKFKFALGSNQQNIAQEPTEATGLWRQYYRSQTNFWYRFKCRFYSITSTFFCSVPNYLM